MKKISLLIVLLFFNSIYSQLIVNNTSITPAQLVQNVLLGAGVSASNIKFNGSLVSANLIRDQAGQFSGTSNILKLLTNYKMGLPTTFFNLPRNWIKSVCKINS